MARTLVYQLCSNFWRGKGGLKAMTNHLKILSYLDVDYVWLGPINESPNHDNGYDISDYQAIDPAFGTMEDFDEFIRVAHSYGIGVLMELVLNHTSLEHPWFQTHPNYYCWTEPEYIYRWIHGLGGDDDSWQFDKEKKRFYLTLFHKQESDLDWFPKRDSINTELVKEFRRIVDYWTSKHRVDGFHVDIPQALNRNLTRPEMDMSNLIFGDQSVEIIRSIIRESSSPFVIVECIDPSYGGLTRHYTGNSPVDYVLNPLIKEEFFKNQEESEILIEASCFDPCFMLDLALRNPNSSRQMTPEEVIWALFSSNAEGVCLHQGQEIGVYQDFDAIRLPDELLKFDDQHYLRISEDMTPADLFSIIRASRYATLPLEEYDKQINNPDSYLNLTRKWIERWKTN